MCYSTEILLCTAKWDNWMGYLNIYSCGSNGIKLRDNRPSQIFSI